MTESKIELNQRKIRKGIRMSIAAQQQQMWEKLATLKSDPFEDLVVHSQSVTGKLRRMHSGWSHVTTVINGLTFDQVVINEIISKQ